MPHACENQEHTYKKLFTEKNYGYKNVKTNE